MLVCFTFHAKPGREREFEEILSSPEGGRRVAKAMGAARNTLFVGGGRMVRVLEFEEGARPKGLVDVAREDPAVMEFLRKLGPLIENGFDVERPETLEAFNRRVMVPLAYDVRP